VLVHEGDHFLSCLLVPEDQFKEGEMALVMVVFFEEVGLLIFGVAVD
jgi:hypothetical protein